MEDAERPRARGGRGGNKAVRARARGPRERSQSQHMAHKFEQAWARARGKRGRGRIRTQCLTIWDAKRGRKAHEEESAEEAVQECVGAKVLCSREGEEKAERQGVALENEVEEEAEQAQRQARELENSERERVARMKTAAKEAEPERMAKEFQAEENRERACDSSGLEGVACKEAEPERPDRARGGRPARRSSKRVQARVRGEQKNAAR
jgi:hypothetical protein